MFNRKSRWDVLKGKEEITGWGWGAAKVLAKRNKEGRQWSSFLYGGKWGKNEVEKIRLHRYTEDFVRSNPLASYVGKMRQRG